MCRSSFYGDVLFPSQSLQKAQQSPHNDVHRNPSPLATVKLEGRVELGSTQVKQEANHIKVAVKKEKKKGSGTSTSEDDVPLVSQWHIAVHELT